MNVFPLHQMNLEEAKQKQFEFVDAICGCNLWMQSVKSFLDMMF